MSDTVTKADIVRVIHEKVGFSKRESAKIVENILEIIKQSLEKDERVKVSGFGSFEVKRKKARKGRNPQTGDQITLPPRKVITFRPSQILRRSINSTL